MAENRHNGGGTGPFSFTFPSIKIEHIQVSVNNQVQASSAYTINNYNSTSGGTVTFGSATASGTNNVRVYRQTDGNNLEHTFQVGSSIKASDLNNSNKQSLFLAEENRESINSLAAGDASGAIQISGSNIVDNSITTSKILDLEVGTNDLGNLSVTTGKIADDAVTTDKLANSINTDIASASFTTGMIMMWSGTEADIPSGWVMCDGNNGTPDLRARFIVGHGSGYTSGTTGGVLTTQLNGNHLPQHSHGIDFYTQNHTLTGSVTNIAQSYAASGSASGVFSKFSSSGQHTPVANDAGGCDGFHFNGTHSHHVIGTTGNTGNGHGFDNRPPFHCLFYIMKT